MDRQDLINLIYKVYNENKYSNLYNSVRRFISNIDASPMIYNSEEITLIFYYSSNGEKYVLKINNDRYLTPISIDYIENRKVIKKGTTIDLYNKDDIYTLLGDIESDRCYI